MSIFTDDTKKTIRFFKGTVDITSHVISESFECEDILCTDQLNLGECNPAKINFTTDVDLSLAGEQIKVTYGTASQSTVVGIYKVTYSSHKLNSAETHITAYDCIKEFDVDVSSWYLGLNFPMTLSAFRSALCNHIGIQQVSATLVNDDLTVTKTINPEKLLARDLLGWIGQVNAVFAHATNDYKLQWISLSSNATALTGAEIVGATSFEAKNYETRTITGVTIRMEDGDIGATAGTKNNAYYINANPFCFGFGTTDLIPIAQNIYSKISGIVYTPCSVVIKYIPGYGVGSKFTFKGKTFYNLSTKIDGVMHSEVSCPGNKNLDDEVDIITQFEQLKGKSNILTRSIEETRSEIADVEQGLTSQIQQTADSINMQITEIQKELDGSINVYYRNGDPTLLNYPAWDFTYNIPCNNTVRVSDSLTFEYTEEGYSKNTRSIAYNLDDDTSFRFRKSESGDSFYWEEISDTEFGVLASRITALEVKNGQITASVEELYTGQSEQGEVITSLSSRITQNASSITAEVSRAQGEESSLSTRITATADGLTSEVTRSKAAESTLSSRISQTATDISSEVTRATTAEGSLSSRITQNADGITSEVTRAKSAEGSLSSRITQTASDITAKIEGPGGVNAQLELKVSKSDNNQIVSMINASANVITLNSNRLVVNSNNFTLTADGKITATGANITGNINAQSGTIAGWSIGEESINNGIPYTGTKDSNSTGIGAYGWNWAFWAGNGRFSVLQDGTMHCENAEISGYTKTAELDVEKARISNIEASYITADAVAANYATIGTLNANVANLNTAIAKKIEASYINTDNICATMSSPSAGIITLGTVRAANYWYYNGRDYQQLGLKQVRASNGTFWLMGI